MTASPVLLITGASSGIGAATARAAVAEGFRVVLTARRASALDELAGALGGPQTALASPCDVRVFEQLETSVRAGLEAFEAIDAVVACAGVGAVRGFRNDDLSRWRAVVETNILGTALTVRACAPALQASGGHLVLIGAIYGRSPAPGSLYSASQRAVAALAESARLELSPSEVRVTLIVAGTVDTPFFDNPQGDALQPDDIARSVLWALRQPREVDISELVVRPTAQRR